MSRGLEADKMVFPDRVAVYNIPYNPGVRAHALVHPFLAGGLQGLISILDHAGAEL